MQKYKIKLIHLLQISDQMRKFNNRLILMIFLFILAFGYLSKKKNSDNLNGYIKNNIIIYV